jgi:hypothetical protein
MKSIESQNIFRKFISGIFTVSCLFASISCESQEYVDKDTCQLNELSIKNDRILLKQDLVRGGAIKYISEKYFFVSFRHIFILRVLYHKAITNNTFIKQI